MKVLSTQTILDELNGRGAVTDPRKRYTITEEWLQAALHALMVGPLGNEELIYSFLSTARKPKKSDSVKEFKRLLKLMEDQP